MIPPDDGSTHAIAISGRTYSAPPKNAIPVPSFDVPVLEANGWQVVSTTSSSSGESWASRFRRLAVSARNKNPVESPSLIGAKKWIALTGAWAPTTAVTIGQLRSNGGRAYLCIQSGTTAASGGPIGTVAGVRIIDNTAIWVYYTGAVGDRVSNGGNVYEITTAGVPATSGGGPTGLGAGISDGSITWAYAGKQTAPVIFPATNSHNGIYTKAYSITGAAAQYFTDRQHPFRFIGGVPRATVFTNDAMMRTVNSAPAAGNVGGWGSDAANYGGYNFDFEGTAFELNMVFNQTTPITIIVDGSYIDFMIPQPGSLTTQFIVIDFTNVSSQTGASNATGRQRHSITIETNATIFRGVNCLPVDTISYPSVTDNFSCAIIGDSQSLGVGVPVTLIQSAFPIQMRHLLGLPNMMICGLSGTGMIADNGGSNTAYIGHAVADLQLLNAFSPLGAIFIQSSQNDGVNISQLASAATSLFQALRAAFPDVPIFVLGNITGAGITLATVQSCDTLIANAVASQRAGGDSLIFHIPAANDPLGPWITGTGYQGNTNGSGSSDVNFGTDGIHMSASGHSLWARKAAVGVLNVIANIP